ncbi:S41 family peptidase [Phaeocystidibacter luteus]|uniref:S41 family peptidase n=1 Tax=Phaeocystidibacter luteus TaxID=911197 RepID=A0A6N6RJQ4_9FLAO|nr:S41 family peptidase [Phaeocystidibacter luteus]KAB2813993.1 S41 family peptidase [Phaeocystidibacter luteus]
MKAAQIYLPLVTAATLVLGMFIGSRYDYPARPTRLLSEEEKEQKIRQIINYIDYEYVDDVNTDSLLDLTIRDMLHRLDPHSSYIAEQDVQANEESIQGHFEGIGIEFHMNRDSLTVVRVVDGGPAQSSGVKAGDRIVSIDGVSAIGDYKVTAPIIETLRGPSGSEVVVEVAQRGGNALRKIQIERGPIPIRSVDVSYLVNDSIGLIKVNRFSETTMDEFEVAIRSLERRGMDRLILDLRDNPGGLLRIAEEMSDAFLKKDQLIVYTQNREGDKDMTFATSRGIFERGELIVLINENSASAAEIVAGALQDNDRATIIGRRSFGKGLVQEEMRLSDGSRMRLTTSRYYTPTGRSIQKPYDNGYESYQRDYYRRVENGELFKPDSSQFDPSDRYITKGGKVVYGGGGIMPDIFVPIDSSIYTNGWLYHKFSYSNVDEFAFEYVDRHRAEFADMTAEEYVKNWAVSNGVYNELLAHLGASEVKNRIDAVMRDFIEQRLKALIGKNIWGLDGFYPVVYQDDPTVRAAMINWGAWTDTVPRVVEP